MSQQAFFGALLRRLQGMKKEQANKSSRGRNPGNNSRLDLPLVLLSVTAGRSLQVTFALSDCWKVKVKGLVAQSCPTLCDPMDCNLPGSCVHGLLQIRILEWVAIPFFRGSSRPGDWTQVSRIAARRFTVWATRESQAREPCNCLNGWSYGERLAKEGSDRQLQEARKRLIGPELLWWKQSRSLHTWCCQGPCKPSSRTTFTLSSHWGRAATGKKSYIYVCRVASVVSDSLRPCRLWPSRELCQGEGFSRQEYWSVLANTGCHTFLEHYISCCPSRQLPWVPGAARTPATQNPHHLHPWPLWGQTQVLQGSLRSKPPWTTHMQRWK